MNKSQINTKNFSSDLVIEPHSFKPHRCRECGQPLRSKGRRKGKRTDLCLSCRARRRAYEWSIKKQAKKIGSKILNLKKIVEDFYFSKKEILNEQQRSELNELYFALQQAEVHLKDFRKVSK